MAPSFEDPPLNPSDINYAPSLVSSDPPQTIVTTTTFTIVVTDPNVGDDLYVRWIGEYPPFSATNSRRLKDDTEIVHSADGTPLQAQATITIDCLYPLAQIAEHPITALVSDRPFLTEANSNGLENLLTGIDYAIGAEKVEAHWVLNKTCP